MVKILDELKEIKELLSLNKQILSLPQVCTFTGLSKYTVYKLVQEGKIKSYRPFGRNFYFDKDEVIECLKQNPSLDNKTLQKLTNKNLFK